MPKFHLGLKVTALWSLSLSLPAMAIAASDAVLVKEFQTGFVMAESARTLTCEVYADKTVITHVAGPIRTVETRNAKISGYQKALAGARKGKLSVTAGAVDIPTVKYYGNLRVEDSDGNLSNRRVTLFEVNGFEGTQTFNPAFEAKLLKNFLDSHCP